MSNYFSYTEMILPVETGLTPVSTTKLIGSGSIIGLSINMFNTASFDTISHVSFAFFSSDNTSGTPSGQLLAGPVSLGSGLRWDGRVFMLPNMSVVLTISCDQLCQVTASILVEHERKA